METNRTIKPATWYDQVFATGHYWNAGKEQFTPLYRKVWDTIVLNGYKDLADIGCGPGLFLAQAPANYKFKYLGIDFSAHAVEAVRKTGHQATQMDITQELPDLEPYDAIILCEVLEHIADDLALLRSLPARKPLVISLPMHDDESHARYFTDYQEILNRYKYLEFSSIRQTESWFVIQAIKR